MRRVSVDSLQSGLIIGEPIVYRGVEIICRGSVLTDNSILLIRGVLPYESEVSVYTQEEVKDALRDKYTVLKYLDLLLDLRTIESTDILHRIKKYFYKNHAMLYELLSLHVYHEYTYAHSVNVALYALKIGLKLELSTEELFDLFVGCLLHDIGKMYIDTSILDKPDELTDEEFKAIMKHPLLGERYVSENAELSDRAKSVILQHHEKLNGVGYPFGLSGDRIGELPRIAAVADIFDAVISRRSYHEKRGTKDGLRILFNDASRGCIGREEVNVFAKLVS